MNRVTKALVMAGIISSSLTAGFLLNHFTQPEINYTKCTYKGKTVLIVGSYIAWKQEDFPVDLKEFQRSCQIQNKDELET